jgi:uncharacterized protein DUF3618
MTQDIKDLEREIEETRARLDLTIDRLQDKLSVSGIVDDVLGTMRASELASSAFDTALNVVKRNPVPVMLVAAGLGWLLYRMGNDGEDRRRVRAVDRRPRVPVLDPDPVPPPFRTPDLDAPLARPDEGWERPRSFDVDARA